MGGAYCLYFYAAIQSSIFFSSTSSEKSKAEDRFTIAMIYGLIYMPERLCQK
jgi:hypothetical protein